MSKRHFGTDGIRGRAGDTLTPDIALRAAFGFAQLIVGDLRTRSRRRPQVVLGCDSRLSSPMLVAAVQSGLNLGGCDALVLGIVPTPLVTYAVLKHKAAGGVMITASHNPVPDNGIKLFGADGFKLAEDMEQAIENVIDAPAPARAPALEQFGTVAQLDSAGEYLDSLVKSIPPSRGEKQLRVVLDCAHGAACAVAPRAFERYGFGLHVIHGSFDGNRINVKCGATDLRDLSRAVRLHTADFGLAFDGDGDRVLAVDHTGRPVSGDKIISIFATRLPRYRKQGAVVMTHMTNIGVEEALAAGGIRMVRTEVGDIQVRQAMQQQGLNLGGEQSGHIIMLDKSRAGDGILAGLQLAILLAATGKPLTELAAQFPEYPQLLTNLIVHDKLAWLKDAKLKRKLTQAQQGYNGVRFYLRPSGTENLVRVLTEAHDDALCRRANQEICALIADWDRTAS